LEGVPASHQEILKKLCPDLWRDMTGTYVFDILAGAKRFGMERTEGRVHLVGNHEPVGRFAVVFQDPSKQLDSFLTIKDGKVTGDKSVFGFRMKKGIFYGAWREVFEKGVKKRKLSYETYKTIEGFELPTRVTLADEKGTSFTFDVRYEEIKNRSAPKKELTLAEIKKAVAAFKRDWRKWGFLEKTERMKELARIDHDLVSDAIAKAGLKDADPGVRKCAAECLGKLGRRNVTIRLVKAMKPNEKHKAAYIAIVNALGKIGDPRAIRPLKDGFGQIPEPKKSSLEIDYSPQKARIAALAAIRTNDSVEAVLDIWNEAGIHAIPLIQDLQAALRSLTEQSFGHDKEAWKSWWRKNKATFRVKPK
ncbi:MAG: HEAT repeat domain-containing protein, partial [Planctomycetota bacterium]